MEEQPCRIQSYLHSISSLYHYYGIKQPLFSFELVEGSLVDIARREEAVSYPGIDGVDALCRREDREVIFSCADSLDALVRHPFSVMNLICEEGSRRYKDPAGCYKDLRERRLCFAGDGRPALTFLNLLEAAALVSAFGLSPDESILAGFHELDESDTAPVPPVFFQRIFLSAVLTGEFPAAGLKLLKDFGFIERFWPELWALVGLEHSKEYHPEGDVWEHTLETLYHRKTADLDLALSLLLHDAGKPDSVSAEGNRFNRHAQIGRTAAASFLRRLEFNPKKTEKICFLVENHMLPAAIKNLPAFRSEKALSSPHFPILLEVFRCDLLSTFRGPDAYYEACKAYRSYLKNTKNPFRDPDGKKLLRLYVN